MQRSGLVNSPFGEQSTVPAVAATGRRYRICIPAIPAAPTPEFDGLHGWATTLKCVQAAAQSGSIPRVERTDGSARRIQQTRIVQAKEGAFCDRAAYPRIAHQDCERATCQQGICTIFGSLSHPPIGKRECGASCGVAIRQPQQRRPALPKEHAKDEAAKRKKRVAILQVELFFDRQ